MGAGKMLEDCGTIWLEKYKYVEAETRYYLWLQKKLYGIDIEGGDMATTQQVEELRKTVDYLVDALKKVELRMSTLEEACSCGTAQRADAKLATVPAKEIPKAPVKEDDDDIDLFVSDDDEEADAVRQERLKAYAEKKAKKPAIIAKSSIVLDVKPWDDETDMKALESSVRSVAMDGLVWGTSKLVPVGYGINKLQVVCVVEDDKVSIDELTEKLTEFEDYIQSVDIAAFNKI
ncbi:elongation factor 1-beta-like isoform X1 [Varroa destructor]|uniref:Translation elongation factor EF1B beta/delta subunit guanine nucleotide exchange domain-containing protein n=2 Tax=Varroa destructor TaxID=109461 RepID=A0A7M7K9A2_VARDE|nr:elongation factor 1-beta-like isoform X1 [Varroa destructor]XP_022662394.1 elongation factor 1-beta-like isoform X1 [Varroa destructor]